MTVFALDIQGNVPFIGHVENGQLFANAACEVWQNGVMIYASPNAVDIPFVWDAGAGELMVKAA